MLESLLLPLVLLLPLGGSLVAATLRTPGEARTFALAVMLATLAAAGSAVSGYDGLAAPLRYAFSVPGIPALGLTLRFGLDGVNLYLVLLTALVFPAAIAFAWNRREGRSRLFASLVLALQGLLMGTFLAKNLLLLFCLWEAVLIPAVILVLVFGGPERKRAAMSFFLYTMAGSVLMLAAVIVLGVEAWRATGRWTFDLDVLGALALAPATETFVFLALALACAVKSPLVPFHAWLPLAYRESSSPVAALMAGVMSKMGAFGLLALAIPLAPHAAARFGPAVMALAAVSIAYGAVLALRQPRARDVVAYASLSHMGYIALGAFAFQPAALHGALFQGLAHGLSVAALFLMLGALEERRGTDTGDDALAARAPRFAVALMLVVLASLALPLTSGFTAEFLVLSGAWTEGLASIRAGAGMLPLAAALLATTGVVLGATYMLRLARALVFGTAPSATPLPDLVRREALALAPLLLLVLWIGAWPAPWMVKVEPAVGSLARPAPAVVPGGPRG